MSVEWNQLADKYYRKTEVYVMQWGDKIELDKHIVCGAPFGGPIAMIPDERKMLRLGGVTMCSIYTSAGRLINQFDWPHRGLIQMGWTDKENLACILDDGTVHLYSVHGELLNTFDMGPAVKRDHVAECIIWGSGMVVRTANKSEVYALEDFDAPAPYKLADTSACPSLARPPTCMTVIPPQFNASGSPEVLLGTATGSIVVVDKKEAQDQLLEHGPFAKMVVSPSGGLVACFSDDGTLFVMTTEFDKNLSRFATKSKLPPKDMVWCGEEAVVLYWDRMILVVGHFGDFIKYGYESALVLVPETDGVRVVSETNCQFLQQVPEATEKIFKLGSTTPAARLFDAAEAFENKSVEADSHLRGIKKDDLRTAIDDCLNAAAHEFNPSTQRSLLKAASYGKLSCESYKADRFVDMCRTLRVLNAVRHVEVGCPITFDQYTKLEADVLIDRLINKHQHLLAFRICKYLRIPPERVLIHWACAKIRAFEEERDEELGRSIVEKMSNCPGISYREVATTAFQQGRRHLAAQLLEHEPLATVQVPLLLNFKEDEQALNKAIESGDTDLVYSAMLQIRDRMLNVEKRPFEEFFAVIRDKPLARNLYLSYCRQFDLASLKRFYYMLQRPTEAANIAVLEAYQAPDWKERMQGLDIALQLFQKDKTNEFPAAATEEQIRLLKFQREAEVELARERDKSGPEVPFIDLSVSEVIEQYIALGKLRNAVAVKNAFKVPDNRFWYIEVRTLAKAGNWAELAKLTANKKAPPIGFQPFVEACVEQKNFAEAARYIARLPDPHEQMEWFGNIGYWKEAADVAARERDMEALQLIRSRCRQPQVVQYIDKLLSGAPPGR